MTNKNPRIVAELGRAETPEETAARKAASSAAYRSSQTVRHLIGALLITVAIAFVVYLVVPRGEPAPREAISVSEAAAAASAATGLELIAPETPEGWLVNQAELSSGAPAVWKIIYAPNTETGYLNFSQAFTADDSWVSGLLQGSAPTATVEIAGLTWDQYELRNSTERGNISYALAYKLDDSTIVLYSSKLDQAVNDEFAASIAPLITASEQE